MTQASYLIRPIAYVESELADLARAPRQGSEGAPDATLVFEPAVRRGIADLAVGEEVIVLTWLHRSVRDQLAAVPGHDPAGRERGVFSTRSPNRPNPIGLHRVRILGIEGLRVRVSGLEAIDGTPVIDLKPAMDDSER